MVVTPGYQRPLGHYIIKCECGILLEQCRCPGGTVTIVSPCIHGEQLVLTED